MDRDMIERCAKVEGGPQYLIRKGSYYYRPNAQGYTANIAEAGRYTLDKAINHTHPNGPDGPRDGLSYEPAPPKSHAIITNLIECSGHAVSCNVQSLPFQGSDSECDCGYSAAIADAREFLEGESGDE